MHLQQAAGTAQEVRRWYGVFGDLWFQNLILAASAIIAIWTLQTTAKQERKRATVETVRDHLKDVEVIKAREILRPHRHAPLDCFNLLRKGNEGSPVRQAALTLLNSYEFMAAGIREGAFDENIYQRMYSVNALNDWQFLFPFVQGLQDQIGKTLFQEFEGLVQRWKEHPLKVDERA